MTERGQPIDVALACPFVAFEGERDERSEQPDPRHRCYAENPPSPLSRAHQEAYCLSPTFAGCPIFREWARREAARVQMGTAPEEPPVRPREEPTARDAALGWAAEVAERDPVRDARRPPPPTFGSPPPVRPPESGSLAPQQGPWTGEDRRAVPDVPSRPGQQTPWSQPPPWLANRGGAPPGPGTGQPGQPGQPGQAPGSRPPADANEGLDRLVGRRDEPWRTYAPDPAAPSGGAPGALARPPDERPPQRVSDPSQGLAGSIADESAAALASRLAAIGMAGSEPELEAPLVYPPDAPPPVAPSVDDRRYQDLSRLAVAVGDGAPVRRLPPPEDEIVGAAALRELPRSTGALSRILRWNRPQAVDDTRGRPAPQPRRVVSPAWDGPRRNEAYPTIRTRSRLPSIPRVLLGLVALAAAAALLFFLPSLFIGQPGGAGGDASPSAPAASGSVRPAGSPTRPPGPTPRVYVVKQGDTLSRIAQRFGVTVDEILAANPTIKNPNSIQIGDKITIPTPTPSEISEPTPEPSESA